MPAHYYRLLPAFAASLLLLAGCNAPVRETQADANVAELPQTNQQASTEDDPMNTEATIWTVLGLAKKPSQKLVGPQTGPQVSPELWQAAIDTLNFVKVDSLDPQSGLLVTDWYTPQGKPAERMRVTAFVKARALRSDSIAVTIERQTRSPSGQWEDGSVAQQAVQDLENDILQRAREVHIARLRLEQ